MSYHVISFTMMQVRQGALTFQRVLGGMLREHPDIKVFTASPFDLEERKRLKDQFGGDVVYFFNEAAVRECEHAGLKVEFLQEVADNELPKRRSLVVGVPERAAG